MLTDALFRSELDKPAGWFHLVMNYIGPAHGQGITIYTDGALRGSDTTKDTRSYTAGDGRVVIGRWYTNGGSYRYYGGVMVDELNFWNRTLTLLEIQAVYNMHK